MQNCALTCTGDKYELSRSMIEMGVTICPVNSVKELVDE